MTESALLLSLIEEANYNYDNIEDVVQAKINECQKQINELKAMSQEQFLAAISKSMFGVAMKEYYIGNLEKRIKRLKDIPEHIDNLLEYWRDSKFIFNESIKFYKPYVRQLKQAFQKLAESKFNSKLSSFSLWVKNLVENEFDFRFYCSQCKQHFLYKITREPTQVSCPNGHKLGVWSFDSVEDKHCKICANQPIIATLHYRKRHDLLTPKGTPILVPDGPDVEQSLSHFATFHKGVIQKAKKAVFGQ